MTFKGTSSGGTIVLEPGAEIADGLEVRVEVAHQSADDPLLKMTTLATETNIPDLATNIDHYLYGHPKVQDGE
jgi:hypothetical protein